MIISKENRSAVNKYKSLERKIQKSSENTNKYRKEQKEILASIPYPIFVKENEETIVAYLSINKKIAITKGRGTLYSPLYEIKQHDVSEQTYSNEFDIRNLLERTTKKEFIKLYKEAQASIREAMFLSTRSKKEMLCEKTEHQEEENSDIIY